MQHDISVQMLEGVDAEQKRANLIYIESMRNQIQLRTARINYLQGLAYETHAKFKELIEGQRLKMVSIEGQEEGRCIVSLRETESVAQEYPKNFVFPKESRIGN